MPELETVLIKAQVVTRVWHNHERLKLISSSSNDSRRDLLTIHINEWSCHDNASLNARAQTILIEHTSIILAAWRAINGIYQGLHHHTQLAMPIALAPRDLDP